MEGIDSHCQGQRQMAPKWFIKISSARKGITNVAIWEFPINQLQELIYYTRKNGAVVRGNTQMEEGSCQKKQAAACSSQFVRHYFSCMRMIRKNAACHWVARICHLNHLVVNLGNYQIKLLFAWPAQTRCSSGCSWIPEVKLFRIDSQIAIAVLIQIWQDKIWIECLLEPTLVGTKIRSKTQSQSPTKVHWRLKFKFKPPKMSPYPCPWATEIQIFTHLDLKFNLIHHSPSWTTVSLKFIFKQFPNISKAWGRGCYAQTLPRSKNEARTQRLRNVDRGASLCFLPFWAGLISSLKKCILNKSNQRKIQNLLVNSLQSTSDWLQIIHTFSLISSFSCNLHFSEEICGTHRCPCGTTNHQPPGLFDHKGGRHVADAYPFESAFLR